MTKYASERLWRTPDGKLVTEAEVPAGVLGTSLAYAEGDPLEDDDASSAPKGTLSDKEPAQPNAGDPAKPPTPPAPDAEADEDEDEPVGVTVPPTVEKVSAPKAKKA